MTEGGSRSRSTPNILPYSLPPLWCLELAALDRQLTRVPTRRICDATSILFCSTATTHPSQVLEKVMPINESGSDPYWVNDTVEVFRVCPEYGIDKTSEAVTVIGRNFRDSDVLACRFTPCRGTGAGPLKCQRLTSSVIKTDEKSIEVAATYVSSTRVQCPVPAFTFPSNESLVLLDDVCEYDASGALAYVQTCEAEAIAEGSCGDGPEIGIRFVYDTLVRAPLEYAVRTFHEAG